MNLINWLWHSPPAQVNAKKLYGAIVAQARLPEFYAVAGVPDSLEGRFVMLSLHVFAVLHRLKAEGEEGRELAQELVDIFAADMETVLREAGVSDLRIPKTVRAIAASNHGNVLTLERAYEAGCGQVLQDEIAAMLPLETEQGLPVARRLAAYVEEMLSYLAAQPTSALDHGTLRFPALDSQPSVSA
jgi:cytochrome b pre-mRNA-processing protein 3